MRHLLVLATLSTTFACYPAATKRQAGVKIVGGQVLSDLTDATAASTVAIIEPYSGQPFCTGTVIGPQHVVTAAHCIKNPNPSGYGIGFGPNARNTGVQVSFVLPHPEWNTINDIAVIATASPIPDPLKPVPIAPMDLKAAGAQTQQAQGQQLPLAILAGYGTTGERNQDSGTLRKTTTPIGAFQSNVKEFQLMEGDGKGSCYGDSGGPAYVNINNQLMVIGATSRGSNCDIGNGTYADVRYYIDWMTRSFAQANAPINLKTYEPGDAPTGQTKFGQGGNRNPPGPGTGAGTATGTGQLEKDRLEKERLEKERLERERLERERLEKERLERERLERERLERERLERERFERERLERERLERERLERERLERERLERERLEAEKRRQEEKRRKSISDQDIFETIETLKNN